MPRKPKPPKPPPAPAPILWIAVSPAVITGKPGETVTLTATVSG